MFALATWLALSLMQEMMNWRILRHSISPRTGDDYMNTCALIADLEVLATEIQSLDGYGGHSCSY